MHHVVDFVLPLLSDVRFDREHRLSSLVLAAFPVPVPPPPELLLGLVLYFPEQLLAVQVEVLVAVDVLVLGPKVLGEAGRDVHVPVRGLVRVALLLARCVHPRRQDPRPAPRRAGVGNLKYRAPSSVSLFAGRRRCVVGVRVGRRRELARGRRLGVGEGRIAGVVVGDVGAVLLRLERRRARRPAGPAGVQLEVTEGEDCVCGGVCVCVRERERERE